MDRFLFDQFVFEMDDEMYDNSCIAFAKMASNIVRNPNTNKVTFNYYPHDPGKLQLVVEGTMDDNNVQIEDVKIHHTSEDVWKLKIVAPIPECEGSFIATRPDGNGLIAIRLVNEQVLEHIEEGDLIEAQVVALALDVHIYQDEAAYADSVSAKEDNEKILMADGLALATDFLVNNSATLTEEERQARDHRLDYLVDVRGTITMCYKYPLHMFDVDLNSYYLANIATDFGQVKVIIPQPMFPKDLGGFGVGNVIVAKVLLSGDVCIYDYDKYASPLNK